jgi:hypothetical protein
MEPIVHAIIPLLFILAIFPNIDKKYLLLIPIVWIIDLDSYFGMHRFYLHNIFFILALAIIIYFLWNLKASLILFYFGISHLILDLGFPGIAIFYPFLQKTFFIITNISLFNINFSIGSITKDEYFAFAQTLDHATYFGEISLMFTALILLLITYKYRYLIFKK